MNPTVHNQQLSTIQTPDLQIMRKPQALNMLGISKSNFHNKINAGLLPPGITLGANSVGYFKHEITAVLVAMATNKSQDEIKALIISLTDQRQQLAA